VERRLVLELIYQLSTHVRALEDPRGFFAILSFVDVPGSRLRKSDLVDTVMEYKLEREMTGGADVLVTDVPSLLFSDQTISGIKVAYSGGMEAIAKYHPPGATNGATERIRATDSLQGILDRLDAIPATTTSTPIKALAGMLVDKIKALTHEQNQVRCAEVLEVSGWNFDRNVPSSTATDAQLKAGVLRAARLAVQQFPEQEEEALVMRYSKFADPGNVRPHYGAFSDPRVVQLQEQEMQCEALLYCLLDVEQCTSCLDDLRRTIRGTNREQGELKALIAQLTRAVQADQEVVADFQAMQAAQASRVQPRSRMQWGPNWQGTAMTNSFLDTGNTAAFSMIDQTTATLQRHQARLGVSSERLATLQATERDLQRNVVFHERQLDICVTHLQDSGIKNLRGSERYDMRKLPQQLALDGAVFVALDRIVDAVARLKKVNRGFTDLPGEASSVW